MGSDSDSQQFVVGRTVTHHPGGIVETNQEFYVGPNEEIVFQNAVELRAAGPIVIDGVLRGATPNDSQVSAPDMHLSSLTAIVVRGKLSGFQGADGVRTTERGGNAGSLELHAPIIVTNHRIMAPRGGHGGPGGGSGGAGGMMSVYALVYGPVYVPAGSQVFAANISGGRGGRAADGNSDHPHGGHGGSGGGAISGLFRELPWMVKYREDYLLSDQEIREAQARGEIR